jgi:hypothetical protein
MRADLNKQLCEQPRSMSRAHYHGWRHAKAFNPRTGDDDADLPTRESMKKRYGYDTKQFGEHLSPLYGNVRKAVGRKWDAFYSDLCKNFDKRSTINNHILQHLYWYVEVKNVYVGDDGELWIKNAYGDHALKGSGTEFYVDPRDGIIKRNKHYQTWRRAEKQRAAERQKERDKVCRFIDDNNVLHLINGVWFHFELKPIPMGRIIYEKPYGVNEFKLGYAMLGRGLITKTWDEMNQDERKRHGKPRVVGAFGQDLFTGTTFVNTGKQQHRFQVTTSITIALPGDKYHATKQTASRKMLKKAGVV